MDEWVRVGGMYVQGREDGGVEVIRPTLSETEWERFRMWPPSSGLGPEHIGTAATLGRAARL